MGNPTQLWVVFDRIYQLPDFSTEKRLCVGSTSVPWFGSSLVSFSFIFVCIAVIVGFLLVCPWRTESPLAYNCSNHNSFGELSLAFGTRLACTWDRVEPPRDTFNQ